MHDYQVKRNADTLLDRASRAEDDGNPRKAAAYIIRYLRLRPGDADTQARYALLTEQLAQSPRQRRAAFFELEAALRAAPDRAGLRRTAADLAMEIGRFDDADDHLEVLLGENPDDAELIELRGICAEANRDFDAATELYRRAIDLDPTRIDSYTRLAFLFRRHLQRTLPDAEAKADELIREMVRENDRSFRARLASADYWREQGFFEKAAEDITYARERLAADAADVLLGSADLALAADDLEQAREYLLQGLEVHSDDFRFRLGLAAVELRAGNPEEAVGVLKRSSEMIPDDPGMVWTMADMFIDAGSPEDAQALIDRLGGPTGETAAAVLYLTARLKIHEGDLPQAIDDLEKCRVEFRGNSELGIRVDVLLARCYARVGNPEKQQEACERGLASAFATPGQERALRRLLAEAYLARGNFAEAERQYRRLVPADPEVWLTLGRLELQRNLGLAESRRDWPVAETLKDTNNIPEELHGTADYRLLNVDLAIARDPTEDTRKNQLGLLKEYVAGDPDLPEYRVALARLTAVGSEGDRDAALEILREAEEKLGDRVAFRLARADILASGGADAEELRELEGGLEGFPEEDRHRLLLGLTDAYARLGEDDDRGRLLGRLADGPMADDLTLQQRYFDFASHIGDAEGMRETYERIREIEGEDGPSWRLAKAAILMTSPRDDAGMAEAAGLLEQAEELRPGWSRIPLLEARLFDLQGRTDLAIEKYVSAIRAGESGPAVFERAFQILTEQQRIGEAKRVLLMAQNARGGVLRGRLGQLAAEQVLREGGPTERTLEIAEASVDPESTDHRDHLWLGQLYAVTERNEKAEESFRRAVELGQSDPSAWATWVSFLAGRGRRQEAMDAIARAERALQGDARDRALASAYESIGERDKALESHLALLARNPDKFGVTRNLIEFRLRGGEVAEAEALLEQMILTGPGGREGPAVWARRTLALARISDSLKDLREARELIERNLEVDPGNAQDLRAKALILALTPGERGESIEALEESFRRVRPTPNEELWLARLYVMDGDWDKARPLLVKAAGSEEVASTGFLAYFIKALLRHGDVAIAEQLAERLRTVAPGSAAAAEMDARLLHAKGRGAEAAAALKRFAEENGEESPRVFLGAGQLCEEFGRPGEAEELIERFVAETKDENPSYISTLALFHARQGRTDKALDICEKLGRLSDPNLAASSLTELAAEVGVAILRLGKPSRSHFERVQGWIDRAIERQPDSGTLVLSRADLADARGEYDKAIGLYREVLALEPFSERGLNNLAWLTALHAAEPREARVLIDKAISAAGAKGGLLDTRGVVSLSLGRPREALQDLLRAVEDAELAHRYFHLAQAYSAAGDAHEAGRQFRKAIDLGLTEGGLHALEGPAFRDMKRQFRRPSDEG